MSHHSPIPSRSDTPEPINSLSKKQEELEQRIKDLEETLQSIVKVRHDVVPSMVRHVSVSSSIPSPSVVAYCGAINKGNGKPCGNRATEGSLTCKIHFDESVTSSGVQRETCIGKKKKDGSQCSLSPTKGTKPDGTKYTTCHHHHDQEPK